MTTSPFASVRMPLVAVVVLAAASCTDLDIVPPDAQLTCTSDDDCPDGFACRTAIGRCLENGLAQAAPIAVVTPTTLNATRRSRRPGASTLIATATFSTTPTAVSGRLGDRELACEGGAATVSCTIDLASIADLEEGDVDVELSADDGLGTIASSRARVTIDLTAPDIVAGSAVVRYVRDADNVLDAPTAVGPHSDATLQFSLTEAPGPTPTATLDDGTPLAFDAGLTTGRLAGLVIDGAALPAPTAGDTDANADVVVTLTDDVGNSRSVVLTDLLRIDQTAPAAAAVTVADAVIYRRIPEGSRATAGVPRLSVVVSGGVEPLARVFVTTEEALSSTRLGEAIADDAGSVTVDLAPVDLGRVFVHVVDEAGNVAPAARVRDIVWTASVAGRIPGNDRSNPHALFSSSSFDGVSLLPHLRDELATGQDLVVGDGVTVTARGAFVQDPLVGAGTPRTAGVSLVWHAARGEVLAFGGATEDALANTSRLLRLDGDRWVTVVVDGVLPPPAGGTAVYDPAGERLVLVQDSGDTWFLESSLEASEGLRWRQHIGDEPTAGSGASVAWDEGRRGVVRFGGRRSNGTALDETWFFDGVTWQALTLSTSPPARHQAAMGYDRVDGCLLLRGGRQGSGLLSDLWCLEPDGWRLIAEGQQAPVFGEENPTGSFAYASGAAVTDPVTGRVQFIGGTSGQQTLSGSVVTFDGERLSPGPAFSGLVFTSAAWDIGRRRLVSLGGSNFNLGNNLQVHFIVLENGVARRPPESRRGPGEAENALTAWDDANDRVVMLGGTITLSAAGIFLTSTRAWDGTTGAEIVGNTGTAPFGGIAFDGARIMGVGGSSTFRLDGNAWVVDQPLPPGMPSSSVALTYHAGLDAAFAFGGTASDVTDVTATIRDGVVTTLTPTTRPPARRSAQVVYDVATDRVVLFGGRNPVALRDTWVFEGGDWRELATTTTDVLEARLVYDDVRGVVVRLGEGSGATALIVDELRDDAWVRRDVVVPGPARVDANAAYDRARQETFVCGGFAAGTSRDEVFTWDGDVDTRPAALFSVDLRAREAAVHTIRDITVVARAGATGADLEGTAIDGVSLLAWGDAWEPLAERRDPLDGPADVTVVIDDARLDRVVRDRFVLAVAGPPSGAGPGARVQVETLEVTVRYRED